jgi:hypothetical protein
VRIRDMAEKLDGLRVAILVTDGFERSELEEPRQALDGAEPRPGSSPRPAPG